MANTIITSKMTQILSLEMAKNAGFLKIGSKDYFSDQINGKMRTGKEYNFVLPDAGNIADGLEIDPRDIVEKIVPLEIQNKNNSVQADALELVTDIKWEDEVAKSYAAKLMNAIVKEAVEKASSKATTAFVGSGFQPLAKASAHLQSIVNENLYGFCDPQMQAVLAANGQQFVPNGAPGDLYSKGKLGMFQGVDYKAERFLKPITVNLSGEGSVSAYVEGKLTITGLTGTIKAGTPIFVEGVYACDTVGDPTTALYAFIAKEDSSNGVVVVEKAVSEDIGSREMSKEPESGDKVIVPENGTYYRAIVRADGSYCYSPVNTLDFKLSEGMTAGETDGIKVFCNAFTNGNNAVNTIRWDAPYMAGTVEKRAVSVAYIKQ